MSRIYLSSSPDLPIVVSDLPTIIFGAWGAFGCGAFFRELLIWGAFGEELLGGVGGAFFLGTDVYTLKSLGVKKSLE